jgi:hypothetical protein
MSQRFGVPRVPLLTNNAFQPKKQFGLQQDSRTSFAKLDPSKLDPHMVLFFIGKRASGKTTLMREVCYNMHVHTCKGRPVGMVLAFCGTEGSVCDVKTFVPETLIYKGFNEAVVAELLEKQAKLIEQKGKENVRTVVLVIDDCAFDKTMWKSEAMRELVFNGRHNNITLIVTVQYLMDVPTWLRTNIDMTFVMLDNNKSNRKKYHDFYFGQFNGLAAFNKAYEILTDDYGAMISKNNSNSTNLQETVFWFKSQPDKLPPTFQMGHQMFWSMDKHCAINTANNPTHPNNSHSSHSSLNSVTSFTDMASNESRDDNDHEDEYQTSRSKRYAIQPPGHIVM